MRIFWAVMFWVVVLASTAGADLRSIVVSTLRMPAGKAGSVKKGLTIKREPLKLDTIVGAQPMVMLYWNPAVAASVEELKRFDALAKQQANSKIVYLAAARALDEREIDAITIAVLELNISVPVLLDQQLAIAQELQTPYLPAYYGIDSSGQGRLSGLGSLLDLTDTGKSLEAVLAAAVKELPAIRPAPLPEPVVGGLAPDFTLPDLDGNSVRLSSLYGGKNILLIFWSAYCPHCQKELPRIQRYLTARNSPFTAVSITRVIRAEDRAATEAFASGEGIRFPVLIDGGQVLAKYQVKGIPQWMVIDPKGKILTIQTGEKPGLEGLLQRWEK